MLIELPDDVDWVAGMATDDWSKDEQIKVNDKIFTIPKVVAYLFSKYEVKMKDYHKQLEVMQKANEAANKIIIRLQKTNLWHQADQTEIKVVNSNTAKR